MRSQSVSGDGESSEGLERRIASSRADERKVEFRLSSVGSSGEWSADRGGEGQNGWRGVERGKG